MNPASLPSVLSPCVPRSRSFLRTLVLYYMQALRKEVILLSTRIAKMGNLLYSTVQCASLIKYTAELDPKASSGLSENLVRDTARTVSKSNLTRSM
ncbi:hypothetical protein EJ02DRAFT_449335, partial [Clathrospora elynae]